MNTIHEEQLREAFSTLVPEAPDSAARTGFVKLRVRRRRGVVIGGSILAAAAVAAIVAGPQLLASDKPGREGTVAVDTPPALPDPLTSNPCPEHAPVGSADVLTPFPPADDLATIRWCRDPDLGIGPAPGAAELARDALVTGFDDLASGLEAVETADPGRCAATTFSYDGSYLWVTLKDGSQQVIKISICFDAQVGQRVIDAADLGKAFQGALDAQRTALGYAVN